MVNTSIDMAGLENFAFYCDACARRIRPHEVETDPNTNSLTFRFRCHGQERDIEIYRELLFRHPEGVEFTVFYREERIAPPRMIGSLEYVSRIDGTGSPTPASTLASHPASTLARFRLGYGSPISMDELTYYGRHASRFPMQEATTSAVSGTDTAAALNLVLRAVMEDSDRPIGRFSTEEVPGWGQGTGKKSHKKAAKLPIVKGPRILTVERHEQAEIVVRDIGKRTRKIRARPDGEPCPE